MSDWQEIETFDFMLELAPDMHTFRRRTTDGTLTVIAGTEKDGFHMSISHPRRYPTWDEICEARDRFTPVDTTMVQFLPPREDWVNVHNHCFHLWEHHDREEMVTPAEHCLHLHQTDIAADNALADPEWVCDGCGQRCDQ